MLRVALGASCSLGSLAALGMLLAACGGTIVGPPDSSSGNAGTSPGGQAAGGSAGASPTNGGAGGAMGGAPSKTLSPEACLRAGGQPVSSKGGRLSPETDCESGVALAIIDSASSGWDEGGLCCAIGKDPMQRACGARAGDTCSATEFCAYEPPQLCGPSRRPIVLRAAPGGMHRALCAGLRLRSEDLREFLFRQRSRHRHLHGRRVRRTEVATRSCWVSDE